MNHKKLNIIIGWMVFAIATVVYFMTLEETTSLWDCGEYITTAYKLEVGHPPGAPLFMMLGRIFSMFTSPENAAYMINAMSGLSSSFTILFLFWSITMIVRKLALKSGEITESKQIAIFGAAVVGALAYTFSDSFWFSAVEGEVYAMSSLFTALVFWAILKWDAVAHEKHSTRWIVFIAYLMGLSIGVHLLNLLAIPAMVFLYYFKTKELNYQAGDVAGVKTVTIEIEITGIGLDELSDGQQAYPNPVEDVLYLDFDNQTERTIQVYNGLGLKVAEFVSEGNVTYDASKLASGVYYISVLENGTWSQTNFVKH